jgi:hypothetical protein
MFVKCGVTSENGHGGGSGWSLVPIAVADPRQKTGLPDRGTDIEHPQRLDVGGARRPFRQASDLGELVVGDRRGGERVGRAGLVEQERPPGGVKTRPAQ